jgi:membrane-bound lytic murein transglycosylase B
LREDVVRFAEAVAERRELDVEWVKKALAQARFIPLVTRYIMPPTTERRRTGPPTAPASSSRSAFVPASRSGARTSAGSASEDLYGAARGSSSGSSASSRSSAGRWATSASSTLATLAFDFPERPHGPQRLLQGRARGLFCPLQERRHRSARLARQLRRRARHGAVHAVELQQVRGRLRRRQPRRPARQRRRRVGSIAHYLAEFGWKRGLPARFEVQPPSDPEARAALLAPDIVPSFTAAEMIERGARLPDAALAVESLFALVELQNGDAAPSYVAGTSNFYTITRYNWSSYYAMAVMELGEAVRAVLR